MLSSVSPATSQRKAMNDETVVSAADLCVARLLGKEIHFAEGLLGFPDDRHFKFSRFNSGDGSESPFFLLESVDGALSFPLIHPDLLAIQFHLPVFPELLDCLHAAAGVDLVPLLIVTVRDSVAGVTVNLQGPLVINPDALLGTQLVIENYPLRHGLLSTAAPEL